jgi:hypothetical protein
VVSTMAFMSLILADECVVSRQQSGLDPWLIHRSPYYSRGVRTKKLRRSVVSTRSNLQPLS